MPLIRRFGRPGLIGTAARTAVIAGTASATAGAVRRHQYAREQESYEEQQLAAAQEQRRLEAAASAAAREQATSPQVPSAAGAPLVEQIQRLAELHAAGVLDDAEFAAAKAKLLG